MDVQGRLYLTGSSTQASEKSMLPGRLRLIGPVRL